MKSIILSDYPRQVIQNQFNESIELGQTSIVLNDSDKIYFITAINSVSPWTIDGISLSADPKLRKYRRSGTEIGHIQFLSSIVLEEATVSGVNQVSGYFINASRTLSS